MISFLQPVTTLNVIVCERYCSGHCTKIPFIVLYHFYLTSSDYSLESWSNPCRTVKPFEKAHQFEFPPFPEAWCLSCSIDVIWLTCLLDPVVFILQNVFQLWQTQGMLCHDWWVFLRCILERLQHRCDSVVARPPVSCLNGSWWRGEQVFLMCFHHIRTLLYCLFFRERN